MSRIPSVSILLLTGAISSFAGEAAKEPRKVNRIPPAGISVKPEDRAALQSELDAFEKEISALTAKPESAELLPDVRIYYKAVHDALKYEEFFNEKEVATAKTLLTQGRDRAAALKDGKAPWTTDTGLVVRGYVSKIDGSVQPYALVIDAPYALLKGSVPLHVWYHGRGENLSELNFISEHQRSKGDFAPPLAIVLHPYGRYCNANKFAGEVDTFEAIDAVKKHYRIDSNRICVRGFSMGGAACWQMATHYTDQWVAANPGAGFAETAEFTHASKRVPPPSEFEQKLWHLTNATDYAANLFNLPTVAYSGELDGQKQAADIMARAMKAEGLELTHIIGPGAKHFFEPKAKLEVEKKVEELIEKGRSLPPKHVKLVTYTLRYNRMFWITLDALEEHWQRADIDATAGGGLTVVTKNVAAFSVDMNDKLFGLGGDEPVTIDGERLSASVGTAAHFRKIGGKWKVEAAANLGLEKHHGLQGPIDDAFFDSFVMVAPTGKAMNEKVGQWTKNEMAHAIEHWRRQYRGEAPVVKDSELTEAQIKNSNLILWGDPTSNLVLNKIVDKLPIVWTKETIVAGAAEVPSGQHVLLMSYPNPLNPEKYVVLNSGFTFREEDYLNNAKQVAKIPDWAIIDISEPPTPQWPGKIAHQNFFDEKWQLKK